MRISELAAATDVPVHTLKFYLREGVLHPGLATARTRAVYDDSHVQRVRLVRALVEHGGLSLDAVRRVVATLEAPPPSRHELLGAAAATLAAPEDQGPPQPEVKALLGRLGWSACDDGPPAVALGRALHACRAAGVPVDEDRLDGYAAAMRSVAALDLDLVEDAGSPEEAVRTVVVGTTLLDPVLVALRRLAQEAESHERG